MGKHSLGKSPGDLGTLVLSEAGSASKVRALRSRGGGINLFLWLVLEDFIDKSVGLSWGWSTTDDEAADNDAGSILGLFGGHWDLSVVVFVILVGDHPETINE